MADTGAQNEQEETVSSILLRVSQNTLEPSTVYRANLKAIYRAPKADCIIHLEQMDVDVLKTLKAQLFNMFLTEHPNESLQQNGFPLPGPRPGPVINIEK